MFWLHSDTHAHTHACTCMQHRHVYAHIHLVTHLISNIHDRLWRRRLIPERFNLPTCLWGRFELLSVTLRVIVRWNWKNLVFYIVESYLFIFKNRWYRKSTHLQSWLLNDGYLIYIWTCHWFQWNFFVCLVCSWESCDQNIATSL